MESHERELARQRGQRTLDAMRRRAGRLRRRVVATAVVGFAVLWTAVFVQMATGHDPALGTGAAPVRAAAQENAASDPERRAARAAAPPPSEAVEVERLEAERIEAERFEAEAAELEELETVSTGQS